MVGWQKLQEEKEGVEKSHGYGRCKVRSKKKEEYFCLFVLFRYFTKIREG